MALDALGRTLVNDDFKKQNVAGIPRSKFRFYIFEKDGSGRGTIGKPIFVAGFTNINGLDADVEPITWNTGDSESEMKLPGKLSHSNVTLEKGYDDKFILREWFHQRGSTIQKSDNYMLDCGIVVMSSSLQAQRLILISNAWVTKYKPGDLQSDSTDPWIESVELCHEGWCFGNDSFTDTVNSWSYDLTGKGDLILAQSSGAPTPVLSEMFFKVS